MFRAGTPATLEVVRYVDDVPADPVGSVAVTVRDELGAILAQGAGDVAGDDSGLISFELDAGHVPTPRRLVVTWEIDGDPVETLTTWDEAVGELLFSIAAARAYDAAALGDAATYPASTIAEGRASIADEFREILGFNLGERWAWEVLDGPAAACVRLRGATKHVRALGGAWYRARGSSDWTAYSDDDIADVLVSETGELVRDSRGVWPSGPRTLRVAYLSGLVPIPGDLRTAALRVLRHRLVSSNLDDRATSQHSEFGAFTLATAGRRNAAGEVQHYGIPAVDVVLNRYRRRAVGIA
jgi:hypothetical protein